jgi:UrcA family protein
LTDPHPECAHDAPDGEAAVNTQSVKESIMSITKVFRTNAMAMAVAWAILASGPMIWVANAAHASEPVAHKVVKIKDLNLSTPEGAAVLYGRITRAANEVCGTWDRFNLSQSHAIKICFNEAVSRAVTQINSPMLTSLYEAKTGKADKKVPTLAQAH